MKNYKNVLIITDNLAISLMIADFIKQQHFNDVNWVFGISPYSNIRKFDSKLDFPVNEYDLRIDDCIKSILSQFDLVFSLHCKQIFPKQLLDNIKCINVHPGYNPTNRGWYPQVFSILNDTEIGATIHEIDELLDHGPIIDRELVEKNSWDTSLDLYNRVIIKEFNLFKKNIRKILSNDYTTYIPTEKGNLYLKSDFNSLKEIDLNEQILVGDFMKRLRAMSHGDFDNLYYIDEVTGKKIYIKLKIKVGD